MINHKCSIEWTKRQTKNTNILQSAGKVMKVKLGTKNTEFPGPYLGELEPCNRILQNVDALRKELNDKGYLFVKRFHERDDVLKARDAILQYIDIQGSEILDTNNYSLNEGVLNSKCGLGCVPMVEGKNDVTHCDAVLRVIEGNHAFSFFENLFGEKAITFDYKWLRAMHSSGFTGAHIDRVYMSKGSQELLTLWTPFGDVPANMGVLAVCEGSHNNKRFNEFHRTYGECDMEADGISGTGWFSENPDEISKIGGNWKTANFEAGDAIIFNIRLVHMSTANLTNFLRLSCDTRWQPRAHKADSRYVGEIKPTEPAYGVYGNEDNPMPKLLTVDSLKEKWGF